MDSFGNRLRDDRFCRGRNEGGFGENRGYRAYRAYRRICGMVDRGEASWASLPAAEREEMAEVVATLTEAAAEGYMEAQACLGGIYTFGDGVAVDEGRAFELRRQAAQQGDAGSQFSLGNMYRDGRGCEQSAERAAEWWARAAEQGYANAQYSLGRAVSSKARALAF